MSPWLGAIRQRSSRSASCCTLASSAALRTNECHSLPKSVQVDRLALQLRLPSISLVHWHRCVAGFRRPTRGRLLPMRFCTPADAFLQGYVASPCTGLAAPWATYVGEMCCLLKNPVQALAFARSLVFRTHGRTGGGVGLKSTRTNTATYVIPLASRTRTVVFVQHANPCRHGANALGTALAADTKDAARASVARWRAAAANVLAACACSGSHVGAAVFALACTLVCSSVRNANGPPGDRLLTRRLASHRFMFLHASAGLRHHDPPP